MLELKNKTEQYQLLAADIVAKSPSNWNGSFMINKGSSEGIAKDMAVVSNNLELVGRVITVSEHSSLVLPILDQRSAVGARVQRSREEGVVKGILEQANYCQLTRLPRDADVKKGDMVITSGLGGIFPDGLVIGKVTKVEKGSLAVTAIIKPSAQFNRIEEVFVIQNVLKEEAK